MVLRRTAAFVRQEAWSYGGQQLSSDRNHGLTEDSSFRQTGSMAGGQQLSSDRKHGRRTLLWGTSCVETLRPYGGQTLSSELQECPSSDRQGNEGTSRYRFRSQRIKSMTCTSDVRSVLSSSILRAIRSWTNPFMPPISAVITTSSCQWGPPKAECSWVNSRDGLCILEAQKPKN